MEYRTYNSLCGKGAAGVFRGKPCCLLSGAAKQTARDASVFVPMMAAAVLPLILPNNVCERVGNGFHVPTACVPAVLLIVHLFRSIDNEHSSFTAV